jgi:hypothetical protein
VAAMSVNESGEMGNIDREPSIDASYKASVHLAKRFQRKIFFYKSTKIYKNSSPLKPSSQMNRNLVRSTYERFCIKFPQNRLKGERHRFSPLSL